jgi:LTXXQ motif family protein
VNIKLGILATITSGAILMGAFHSIANAYPGGQYDQQQISPEKMHEHMKSRLDKLAERLEIKASQQAVWEEYAKSVGVLAEPSVKRPNEDADASTISRYRADKATEFAKKLTRVADATAKLQAALTEDQRKILNQVSHRFLDMRHGGNCKGHALNRNGHEWDQRRSSDQEGRHDDSKMDSR